MLGLPSSVRRKNMPYDQCRVTGRFATQGKFAAQGSRMQRQQRQATPNKHGGVGGHKIGLDTYSEIQQ